ncbi:hypothetical protein [Nitrospira sp.]|uniref:hypothetical protein n=1 Tax=Nitrospira sp. TaxID=70125 RepID=UPI003FCC2AD8
MGVWCEELGHQVHFRCDTGREELHQELLQETDVESGLDSKWFNFVRSVSSEGFGRIKYHTKIRKLLDTNVPVRKFMEGETAELPEFYARNIRGKLGPLWGASASGSGHT